MERSRSALDPAVIDKLQNLSLAARQVVEGFMSGHHRSPHRGSSVEFAQHREYVPGDELRRVDWKVYARSERLVVKEFVEETNLTCYVLLDASESMAYGSVDWTKLDYARWTAAAIAHLVLTQRDTAGLVVFDKEHRLEVPSGNGGATRKSIIDMLEQVEPAGPTAIGSILSKIVPRLKRRGIVCIFSDFFDDVDEIIAGVRRLQHNGHEPILFQVLDDAELKFPFDSFLKLQGLEGLGDVKVDPKAIRAAYLEEMRSHNEKLARMARASNVDYVLLNTKEALDAALSTYLAHRVVRLRGGSR